MHPCRDFIVNPRSVDAYTLTMSSVSSATPSVPSATPATTAGSLEKTVTLNTLRGMMRRGERFASLACYDATTARWMEHAGVHSLLVGDSLAEVVLGLPSTLHAPIDVMLALTAAVKRGAPKCYVMGDMPFMSYQANGDDAMRNAGRFLTEGRADAVKLEVSRADVPLIERMANAGIPVIAHFGTRPQHVKTTGYRISGKTADEARRIVDEAVALESAGACMLLIEATPAEVAERIVERTHVPLIGCGAGPACHGQIVVLHDLLGLTPRQPSFARPMADLAAPLVDVAKRWVERIRTNDFEDHPYHMPNNEAERF